MGYHTSIEEQKNHSLRLIHSSAVSRCHVRDDLCGIDPAAGIPVGSACILAHHHPLKIIPRTVRCCAYPNQFTTQSCRTSKTEVTKY